MSVICLFLLTDFVSENDNLLYSLIYIGGMLVVFVVQMGYILAKSVSRFMRIRKMKARRQEA